MHQIAMRHCWMCVDCRNHGRDIKIIANLQEIQTLAQSHTKTMPFPRRVSLTVTHNSSARKIIANKSLTRRLSVRPLKPSTMSHRMTSSCTGAIF